MKNRLSAIREAFERVRPHIRPEADDLAGGLAVAIDQAEAAAAEYDFGDDDTEAAPTPAPAKKTRKGR